MNYVVTFGSSFAVDKFGFVRKGSVLIDAQYITYTGKKSWSGITKLGVFLALTLLPMLLFGVGFGFILALIIIHYFCATDGTLQIDRSTVQDVERRGRQITFKAEDPNTGKTRKGILCFVSKEDAEAAEKALGGMIDGHCPVCLNAVDDTALAFGDVQVCVSCKDAYVQRVKEGVA